MGAAAADYAFTNIGDPIRSNSNDTARLYILDQHILSLLLREGFAYSTTLSEKLNRTQRTINKHLSKLEELNLVQRHGRVRCPFQWYTANLQARNQILELILFLQGRFTTQTPKSTQYFVFEKLLDQVPNGRLLLRAKDGTVEFELSNPREYRDPSRPNGSSIPWLFLIPNRITGLFPIDLKMLSRHDKLESAMLNRGIRDIKELFNYPIGKIGPPIEVPT